MNLTFALDTHKNLLGKNYCHLGTTQQSGFWQKRILLSYQGLLGWKVVELNPLECFFRKLGFFPSTHLNKVILGWGRYKTGRIEYNPTKYPDIPALEKRLKQIWEKSRGSKELPSYTIAFGNRGVKDSQIFAFGEQHVRSKPFRKYLAKVIEKLYRPGDKVLVEGVEAGKTINASDSRLTQYVSSSIPIQGWDTKIEDDDHVIKVKQMKKKMIATTNNYLKPFLKMKTMTPLEIKKFKDQTLNFFKKDLLTFYEFFIPNFLTRKEMIRRGEVVLQNGFSALEKKKTQGPTLIKLLLLELIAQLERRVERAFYTNPTGPQKSKDLLSTKIRNDSLCAELEKYARPGRRVFVIGGLAHFVENGDVDSLKVTEVMKRHGFIVSTPRHLYKPTFNESLFPVSLN